MEGVDFMLHCSPIVIDRLILKDLTFENPECPCQYGMEKNRISISMVTYVSVLPQKKIYFLLVNEPHTVLYRSRK